MKTRYSILFALFLGFSSCSPSIERIQTILDAYISASGEGGPTQLLNVEQTDKGIYSGTYSVAKDSLTLFSYPFTAIVKKDQVVQFFKDTDDSKILVITFLKDGEGQYHSEEAGLDYNVETKAAYEERLRKEEEERARLAASRKAASGSGLGQKGADYLLSSESDIVSVISYYKDDLGNIAYQAVFGQNVITYSYKVVEANGFGTNTANYHVVFLNGTIIYALRLP